MKIVANIIYFKVRSKIVLLSLLSRHNFMNISSTRFRKSFLREYTRGFRFFGGAQQIYRGIFMTTFIISLRPLSLLARDIYIYIFFFGRRKLENWDSRKFFFFSRHENRDEYNTPEYKRRRSYHSASFMRLGLPRL